MFKNYVEVRSWLENFIPLVYGKDELGLARIENLLAKLGNPQKKFKSVHVGGTAGKGSTAFYVSQLLKQKGFKVGLHISPHLVDLRERMVIDGSMMPQSRFVGLANEVSAVVDDIRAKQPQLLPSYFEILVAMSFLYFAKEKVDWAVVEVGLGGRLDATNVLQSRIAVITNVGLDHTEILGDTVEKIAAEKSGIIKKNVPIVTGTDGKALEVIKKVANAKNAPLITLDTQGELKTPKSDLFRSINKQYYSLRSQGSSFASQNKNLALATVLSLGIKLDQQTVKKAFSQGFAGRFEEIDENVVVDGAHNLDKVRALIEFVRNTKYEIRNTKIVLVIAFKQGKDWKKMINLLLENLPIEEVIATEYQSVTDTGLGSAVKAQEIADYIKSKWRVKVESQRNSQEAVFSAIGHWPLGISKTKGESLKANGVIVVTGSLYLVGEVRTMWQLPKL